MDYVAVDTSTMRVYDFMKANETQEELLARANTYKQEDIDTWTRHTTNYPDADQFNNYLEAAKRKNYRVMSFEDFIKAEKQFYISDPVTEITEERYNEMLNVLPPLHWCTIDGVEMFCMSEMLTGTFTSQYAKTSDGFYCKTVNARDRGTWIHHFLKK